MWWGKRNKGNQTKIKENKNKVKTGNQHRATELREIDKKISTVVIFKGSENHD